MKTASKNSAKTNVENPELHFHFKWNPTSDSASLNAWEEENAENRNMLNKKSLERGFLCGR